jgi:predicted dehydrogenase
MPRHHKTTRRTFLAGASAGAVAVGFHRETPAAAPRSASEKLNLGIVGTANHGITNIAGVEGENIAALCDVDAAHLALAGSRYPRAARYSDYRKLLERTDLDAIVVTTPDHTHAAIAVPALRAGLHVYCEKPLAHSVGEVRLMARVAAESGRATQMGNQHHASTGYRRVVEIARSGALGAVREVHAWTNRPLWPQGIERPAETPPVPDGFDWDLWLGPAPARPYHPAYHPMKWRGWWDFGTGAVGDMGPHLIDPAFAALELDYPATVEAESAAVGRETAPKWSVVRFHFPARQERLAVDLVWYDGGKQPPAELLGVKQVPPNGALLIGARASLYVPELGRRPLVVPGSAKEGFIEPPTRLEPGITHHAEWIAACKSGGPTSSNFAYGARLTETCLLGNIAIRTGRKIEWDAREAKAAGLPEADALLNPPRRPGWELA